MCQHVSTVACIANHAMVSAASLPHALNNELTKGVFKTLRCNVSLLRELDDYGDEL